MLKFLPFQYFWQNYKNMDTDISMLPVKNFDETTKQSDFWRHICGNFDKLHVFNPYMKKLALEVVLEKLQRFGALYVKKF